MKPATLLRGICVVLLIYHSAMLAQVAANAERYSQLPASADGIGKTYMGREISAVMGWQGASWLDLLGQHFQGPVCGQGMTYS
jgi:hypothetical protein